jgi:hypothetical protein
MKTFAALLVIAACASCTLTPHTIEPAPPGHNLAVVFDIDGTLTTRVHAIGDTREGAAQAVRTYANAGYRIIYLTARFPLFQWQIPGWLERHGFPEGSIQVTESKEHRHDPASFKRGVLDGYTANGWLLAAAYGDSTTDFEAYADAGIDRNTVFALRRKGAESCEPGVWAVCFDSWPGQMETIDTLIHAQTGLVKP